MIDTSKYNWTKKSSDESGGTLTQEFHDETANVKYARLAWGNEVDKESVSVMRMLFKSMFSLIERIIPQCFKCEVTDHSMEVLYFNDEDIEFRTKTELEPMMKNIIGEKINITFSDIDNGLVDFNSKIDTLCNNEEFVNLFKDVYKKYLDKEV